MATLKRVSFSIRRMNTHHTWRPRLTRFGWGQYAEWTCGPFLVVWERETPKMGDDIVTPPMTATDNGPWLLPVHQSTLDELRETGELR